MIVTVLQQYKKILNDNNNNRNDRPNTNNVNLKSFMTKYDNESYATKK